MKGVGHHRERALMAIGRTKLGLPAVLFGFLFFIALLLGPVLFIFKDSSGDAALTRSRLMEMSDDETELRAMPHGLSGESHASSIPFQILSWKPRALYFPNFATPEQCQNVVKLAKSRLRPSTLALRAGETEEGTKGIRTSSGTFISSSEDSTGTLGDIENKIARATMIPRDHGEAFNVLRYEIGQRYASHYDAFNPAEYGPQKSQRIASFLLYLSDVEEGGETMFPFEGGSNMNIGYDYEKCIGLKVKPHQGDGLLFYSLLTNGTIDPTSLHGSCPVIRGEKWVATKWIRDQGQGFI
ncbi:probable prolyl 4-hydroxylase 9 [Dioscorea cayenensis subsp. rotundata]|uniref:procollagen-proline 4-dioxygenase n=1 Tax=Dioscorea cayennensis subsp. rotundata TaxID=55577 RepID=A0AB40CKW5_DIOCR|nr:probable prolyl 4-hydroxylase 9 [Dioscorea cayenensis subsp. rotundata]